MTIGINRIKIVSRVSSILFLLASFHVYSQTKDDLRKTLEEGDCLSVDRFQNEIKAIQQQDAEWFYLIGQCELSLRHYSNARKYFIKADSLGYPSRGFLLLNLSICDAQVGENKLAVSRINQAVRLGFGSKIFLARKEFDPIREDVEFQSVVESLDPSFDTWTSLFLFVALQALFVFIVLFNLKKGNKQANKILGLLLLNFAVVLFSYVLYWTRYNTLFPYLNGWYHPLLFMSGPLFYLYIRSILTDKKISTKDWPHLAPSLVIVVLLVSLIGSNYSSQLFVNNDLFSEMVVLGTNAVLKIAYVGLYVAMSFHLYLKSKMEQTHLKNWFHYILLGYTGYYLTIVAYYVLVNFRFFNPTWDYMISFAMAFFIFVVSFLGYIYPQALAGLTISNIAVPFKYKNSGLTENAELLLRDELIKAMEERHLYKYHLSLEELAVNVNSNRHYVSLVINKYFDGNYFEFINKYRVEYVKELLLDSENEKTPIISLAYDAGFNNKVSFNKAFKKHTGFTPMSFRATKGKIRNQQS